MLILFFLFITFVSFLLNFLCVLGLPLFDRESLTQFGRDG